jgi:hypothetical protein
MVTPRAHIEVVGVGVIEANPFFRMHLAGPDWPDGTHHAALRRHTWKIWNVERAPRGWVVWSASRHYAPIALVDNEVARVDGIGFKLRLSQDPLARVRMELRDLQIIDTAWPLSVEAPRRLAVHKGRLVELHVAPADVSTPPDDAVVDFVIGVWRWSAVPARFTVPLRFLVDAGVTSPVPAMDIDAWDVALDGSLHGTALGAHGTLSTRAHPLATGEPLFPGVVEGFFPERVREWRELEEQVAML